MADRRRQKQRRGPEEPEKPTKEEYAVAKYLRFNLPTKQGKLVGMPVQYFVATKAVDMLLESKWGGDKAKDNALFTSRSGCCDYMDRLLQKGLFHRASKVEKSKKDKEKDKKPKKIVKEEVEEKKSKKDKKGDKKAEEKEEKDADTEKEEKEEKKEEEKKDEEKKKKKKVRLEMHNHQIFKDGTEVYVWIYDPVPLKTFIIGLLMVLGAIAVCLFPLWPPEVRLGVYYLSLCAAGFVGLMLVLCIIRAILFCVVWCLTMGKHYFWFLPNLTEDVGFFDSFRPLYTHSTWDAPSHGDKKPKKKSDSKDKKEDDKEEEESQIDAKQQQEEEEESGKEEEVEEGAPVQEGSAQEEEEEEGSGKEEEEGSGSENSNGYEFVDKSDIENELANEDDEEFDETEGKKDK